MISEMLSISLGEGPERMQAASVRCTLIFSMCSPNKRQISFEAI